MTKGKGTRMGIIPIVVVSILLMTLNACRQNDPHAAVFNNSVDVSLRGWTSADTLFYPFCVNASPSVQTPIQLHQDYSMTVNLRHSSLFPLSYLPFHLTLQQTDTTGGEVRPIRNLLRQDFEVELRDKEGGYKGDTWGSLYSIEMLSTIHLRFDSVGSYRFLLIPDFGDNTSFPGIASVGIRF